MRYGLRELVYFPFPKPVYKPPNPLLLRSSETKPNSSQVAGAAAPEGKIINNISITYYNLPSAFMSL